MGAGPDHAPPTCRGGFSLPRHGHALLLLAALALGVSLPGVARAQSFDAGHELFVAVGRLAVAGDDGADFGSGTSFSAALILQRTRYQALELEVGVLRREREFRGSDRVVRGTDLTLGAHLLIEPLPGRRLQPFLVAGAGALRSRSELDLGGAEDPAGLEEAEVAWGPHVRLGAGARVFLTRRLSLRAEWRFMVRFDEAFPQWWNGAAVGLGWHW